MIPLLLIACSFAEFRVTAYCAGPCCCGKWADGITASGVSVKANGGKLVAAPKHIPYGTVVHIPGYGRAIVADRGGAIKGNRLDVLCGTHQEALNWGVRHVVVRIEP